MTYDNEKRAKAEAFLKALESYVQAEIIVRTTDQELDSLGAYHEMRHLQHCLYDLLSLEPQETPDDI